MKKDNLTYFLETIKIIMILWIIVSIVLSLILFFARDQIIYPKQISDETVNEYSDIAQKIWNSNGLTKNNIKEIKISNINDVDISSMYTKGIESIDYSNVSLEITLKNDVVIIQKNNNIQICLNDCNTFTHIRSNLIKVTFQNGEAKISKSSYEGDGTPTHNMTLWKKIVVYALLCITISSMLCFLLAVFNAFFSIHNLC